MRKMSPSWVQNDLMGQLARKLSKIIAKSLQSCPTLCDPRDSSQPGSPIPGILQARTLEWAAISFSNAWKWKVKVKSLSSVRLLATPWTTAHQAPPSMGFSRQEYWSGMPLPSLQVSIRCYFLLPTSQKIRGEAIVLLLLWHAQKILEKWCINLLFEKEMKIEIVSKRNGCIFS